jgi:hypothetical protein
MRNLVSSLIETREKIGSENFDVSFRSVDAGEW